MSKKDLSNTCALVLGGHVNGYSIVKELARDCATDIIVFDYKKSLARYSNKVKFSKTIGNTANALRDAIKELNKQYSYIVIYPTNDLQLEHLHHVYDELSSFCYLPFNKATIIQSADKFYQYQTCERVACPYPKTVSVKSLGEMGSIASLTYPLLIKPSTRKDLTVDVFRTLYLASPTDLQNKKTVIEKALSSGVELVVSEFIPGDDTNIYAYTCFRSEQGEILNEWTGKKLTQFPDSYGVFSSASNEAPVEVLEQGRSLVEALDAYGIVEPEFKFDHRDGKFKLMEVNLRSMMWHQAGYITGVKLQRTQFAHATDSPIIEDKQEKSISVHLVLMLHEIPNLILRKGYWRHFKHNVFGGDRRVWAIFEANDLKPFFYSLKLLFKSGVVSCLKRLKLR